MLRVAPAKRLVIVSKLSFLCRWRQSEWVLLITLAELVLVGGSSLLQAIRSVIESDFLWLKFAEVVHGVSIFAEVSMLRQDWT